MLRTHTETGPDLIHVSADIITVNKSSSAGWRKETGKDGHGGCLTSSVVSEEGRDLTFI